MPRSYTKTVQTVGDLKKVLADNPTLPDDAYIWATDPRSGFEGRLIVNISVDKVSTPNEGFPEEPALCFDMEGDA